MKILKTKSEIMKRTFFIFCLSFLIASFANSQNTYDGKKIAVVSVLAENVELNSEQVTKLLRNELIEINIMEVKDEFDMKEHRFSYLINTLNQDYKFYS